MTPKSGFLVNDPTAAETQRTVREIAVPQEARELSTLSRIDYEEAFLLQTGPAPYRTGEEWARAILEGAPIITRSMCWGVWSALGLKVGSPLSDRFVLGWEVRRNTQEFALLHASGRLGLSAELLLKPDAHRLLFATFVQQENILARALWAVIESRHQRFLPNLLKQAVRRRWRPTHKPNQQEHV